MKEQPDNLASLGLEDAEEMLCPHCLKPVDPISHFCNACGGPTSMHSALDPLGQVYVAGHAYRNATGRPTKFIVVLGIWLFFAPQLLPLIFITMGLTGSYVQEINGPTYASLDLYDISTGLAGILLTLGMSVVYFLILFKTTRGYIRTRRRARGLCPMCKYDLRGSKGQETCPECGCAIEWFEDEEEGVAG